MKVDIDLVKFVLQRNEFEPAEISVVMEDIAQEIAAAQDRDPPAPRVKKQFVILISDPHGKLVPQDFTGWVLQIPEDDSPVTALDRLHKSAYDFNQTPKGRRMPLQSIGEACECLPAHITKEHELWIKSKEPILVVRTNNRIPMETAGA